MANICEGKIQYSDQNNELTNKCSEVENTVQHSEHNIEETNKSSEVEDKFKVLKYRTD